LQQTRNIDRFTAVHGSFPIWIVEIEGEKYEFAMARKERKVGQSRQEFECEVNNVTIEEDLFRRCLTINSIAKNMITGEIVDPYGGVSDLSVKMARATSYAFAEDTLRVYRAARFIARFELLPTDGLIKICRDLSPEDISNERVGMELMKMLKTAKTPSKFFYFLKEIGWLQYHFPELHATIGVPQSPIHHPEGDVFTHTMHCIDAAEGWFYRAVMLCHDLGKATTTQIDGEDFQSIRAEGYSHTFELKRNPTVKVTAYGHEEAGVQLTKDMLKRIHFSNHDTIDQIACLVELHMIRAIISQDNHEKILRRTIRKLMKHDLKYHTLFKVIVFDLAGRPPKTISVVQTYDELFGLRAYDIEESDEMTPIVTGKKLIEIGMQPGTEMGKIIIHALELQDRGTLKKDNWEKVLKGCGYKFFNQKTI
jgi:tRNA nucleotidyltransferase (CCA-adding enzyme)